MPPSFPLGPNLVILSDDEAAAWDEVASRSYAGYSSLGPVQASTTALTPLGETPPGGAAAGSGDYALPDEARAYRDEDEGGACRLGQGENEEEGDWLERLRRRDEQLRRESAQQEEGDK